MVKHSAIQAIGASIGTPDGAGRGAYVAVWASAFLLPLLSFVVQRNLDLDLGDEGYLWYGVQRVIAGEVPIRDFNAYDIARYYWSAALMAPFHSDGIIAVRITCYMLQGVGVGIGTFLVIRHTPKPSPLYAIIVSIVLFLWMVPNYKTTDFLASIFLLSALTLLLENPTIRRYMLCGVCVGFAAIIGRNHGVYGFIAAVGALSYLSLKRIGPSLTTGSAALMVGTVLGYAPMLFALILVPGFIAPFWASIMDIFELGVTNIPLPQPWWRKLQWPRDQALEGMFFLALMLFSVISVVALLYTSRKPKQQLTPMFAAAALLAVPYAHYAFSRADWVHLALGIFPFLFALFTIASRAGTRGRWGITLALLGSSAALMVPQQPGYLALRHGDWVTVSVAADTVRVRPSVARELSLLNELEQRFASGGRTFFAAPYWPGAYAVLRRKAPLYDIYALFPRNSFFQREEIQRIEKARPAFAILIETALDGNEKLRYRNTNPLVHSFIRTTFKPILVPPIYEGVEAFVPAE